MVTLKNISIIIPVGPEENELKGLLEDLRPIEKEAELIVVHGTSRPNQLNEGARKATRDFLWFLHADTRFDSRTLSGLIQSLDRAPQALHYFDLRFIKDGPPFMFINETGCWLRSRIMGLPFGDQGFCLTRANFERIGGFPEDVPYGEDHVFVWRALQNRVAIRSTKAILKTSARRYRDQGWFKTTHLYYRLWTEQARPERAKLKMIKSGQTSALAVFAKTPGLTPVKTRLAAAIGESSARAFYELCLNALEPTLTSSRQAAQDSLYPYWAVAEQKGLTNERWREFGRIWQGHGGLGDRLHHVYSHLRDVHGRVILIGTDTPQLPQNLIFETIRFLEKKNTFVLGPARDGGFYLFGGSLILPKGVWTSVTYSQSQTCNELADKIKEYGDIMFLPKLSDVDVYEDIPLLQMEMKDFILPHHMKLRNWLAAAVQKEAL